MSEVKKVSTDSWKAFDKPIEVGERVGMARLLKGFDEISAGNQRIGENKLRNKATKIRRKKTRRYNSMICMAPKSKTEGKGDTPTYT